VSLLHLLLSPFFHPFHQVGMAGPLDAFFLGLIEQFRVNVMAALELGLGFLDRYAVCVGPRILADSRYLPAHLHTRGAPGYLEVIVGDLFGDIQINKIGKGILLSAGHLPHISFPSLY
jgi:hypothetical protein